MKKAIIAGAGLVALTAAGWYGYGTLTKTADVEIERALETYKANLPEGQSLSYRSVKTSLSGAAVTDVVYEIRRPDRTVTIQLDRLTVSGGEVDDAGRAIWVDGAEADGLSMETSDGMRLRAESAELGSLDLAAARAGDGMPPMAFAVMRDLRISNVGEPASLSADSLELEDVRAHAVGQGLLQGVVMADAEDQSFDRAEIGSIEVDSLDLSALAALPENADGGQLVAALSERGLGAIEIRDIVVEKQGADASRMELIRAEHAVDAGRIRFTVEVDGFNGPVVPQQNPQIAELGYERMSGDFSTEHVYDPNAKTYDFTLMSNTWDVGVIKTSGKFVNMPSPDQISAMRDPSGAARDAALAEFRLSWYDQGLLDRIVALQADENGISEDRMRARLQQNLPKALDRKSGEALSRFVERGGTLAIRATPDQPVPLARLAMMGMMQPQGLRKALDLEVTVN